MSGRGVVVGACLIWAGAALSGQTGPAASTRPATTALPGTAEGGWRELRGDPRNSGVSHGPAPSFSGVRWKFIADSGIFNAPAVDAGAVYFASRNGRLFAVRTKDGSKIWERGITAAPAVPDENAPGGVTYASDAPGGFTYSSALIHKGRITIGSEDGHVYCADEKTGDLLWRRHLGGSGTGARVWSSPKTDGRLVFVGSLSGTLWALDPETGGVKWKASLGDEIGASVGILGGQLFVPAKDKRIHVLDAASGNTLWAFDLDGTSMSSPALQLGSAYLRASGGKVLCVDLVNRGMRWSGKLSSSAYVQTSIAHDGERAYVTNAGTIAAFDAEKGGDPLWQMRARKPFDASPIVVGAFVVVAGNDQILHVLDRKSGAEVKAMTLTEALFATPAIVDGIAYVPGASGTLFSVE